MNLVGDQDAFTLHASSQMRGLTARGCAQVEHALARLDNNDAADGDIVRVDLDELAVALDVGVVGGDVHHAGDRLAALAHRIALEQFSYLVEQHDGAALGKLRLGLGEADGGKSADGGDGHEERLVEGFAAPNVAPCLAQHVMAGDKVGDEVERKFPVGGVAAEERVP